MALEDEQVDWTAIEQLRRAIDQMIREHPAHGVTLARVVAVRRDNRESVQHTMPTVGPDPLATLRPMVAKLFRSMAEHSQPVLERAALEVEVNRATGGRTTLHLDQAPGAGRLKVTRVIERVEES